MIAALLLAAATLAAPDNLLANPGFEQTVNGRPARWDLFVQAQEGAYGRLDTPGHNSAHCVALHTPLPYPLEPYNNWSQNIQLDLGGRTLRLRGRVRTVEAGSAMLWVQCWQARPLRVLALADSGREQPVYGTQDWQQVSVDIDVPENTAFITVRCVLEGTGSAWFDDLRLLPVEDDEGDDSAAAATPESAPDAPAEVAEQEAPVAPAAPPEESPALTPAPPVRRVTPEAVGQPESVASETAPPAPPTPRNRGVEALGEQLEAMRAQNAALLEELARLQQQVDAMREEVLSPAPELEAPAPPPLVPRGFNWEEEL